MRAPNAIDFWRGFALMTIFVNHVPGIVFERLHASANIRFRIPPSFSFFSPGCRCASSSIPWPKEPLSALVYRLAGRALTIYFAQLLITLFAIAIIAARRR